MIYTEQEARDADLYHSTYYSAANPGAYFICLKENGDIVTSHAHHSGGECWQFDTAAERDACVDRLTNGIRPTQPPTGNWVELRPFAEMVSA